MDRSTWFLILLYTAHPTHQLFSACLLLHEVILTFYEEHLSLTSGNNQWYSANLLCIVSYIQTKKKYREMDVFIR